MNWCTIFHSRNCFWKFVCKQWTILPWGQRVKALIWSGYICQIGNFKLMWHLFESQLADEQIFIQENVIFNENVVSKSERFLLALSFFQQTDQSNDIKKCRNIESIIEIPWIRHCWFIYRLIFLLTRCERILQSGSSICIIQHMR